MSLDFLYGTADKHHQQAIIQHMTQAETRDPEDQFFLIVPNHIKFESEVNLMTQLQKSQKELYYASTNIQTFSFSRLAWFFLKDTQFYQKNRLDSAAQSMILTKIFRKIKDQLKVFRGELRQPGFVAAIAQQLTELQNEQISNQQLQTVLTQLQPNSDTALKLHDLNLIYDAYLKEIKQGFITNDQLLTALSLKLQQTDLHRVHFYLAGFNQLTASEGDLVKAMIAGAQQVTMALVLDTPYTGKPLDKTDLFFRPKHLQQKLVDFAVAHKIQVHNELIVTNRVTPGLKAIGDYWIQANGKQATCPALRMTVADDTYQEMEAVALKIHSLVVDQGYQYRDFLVMAKHLSEYETVIKPIFDQFKIPYFNDLQIPMQDHPLLIFLTALFDVAERNYQYEAIMRLLKTELLVVKGMSNIEFRRMLDITDNYLLAHNLHQKDWLTKEKWCYAIKNFDDTDVTVTIDEEKSKAIETIHQLVKNQLEPFFKALKQAQSAQEGATLIYNFLKTAGVLDQLVIWQNQAIEAAPTSQTMDRGIQGFNVFVQLLEQYVAILGQTPFEAQTFIDLITAAFTNTSYAQIPSTLDAVNVSEMGMVQMNDRKITFLIGLNDQNLPAVVKPQAVLNDDDRTNLTALDPDFEQLQTAEQLMANDRFLAYLAFLNPTEKLYLSYAQTNSEGQKLQLSPYIDQLKRHFQSSWQTVPSQLPMTEDIASLKPWIGTPRQMIHRLVPVLRQAQDEAQNIGTPLTFIYRTLLADTASKALAQRVFASLQYQNQPEILKPQVVEQLFGETLRASVSQLETYYQNPYAYFLTYGLKLKEREIYDLSPASRGSFYHEVMDEFIKTIVREQIDLEQLTDVKLDQLLDQILTTVYQLPQYDILSSTGRMRFIRYRLKAILKLSIKNNVIQSRLMAPFKPYRTEVPFGIGQDGLRGLSYPIGANHRVNIRGKIDRIDVAQTEGQCLFNIIDYKSSAHDFDYQRIYQGLSLQMLTYLQSVLDNLEILDLQNAKFAGAYYFHLQNPSINLKDLGQNITSENIEAQVLKEMRYQGIFQNEASVLEHLDNRAVKVRFKNDGALYSSDGWRAPNPKQLQTLQDYNTYKIKQAATDIFAGKIPLAPVRLDAQKTVLDYSPYQSIFEFDPMLPENNYQVLKILKAGSKSSDKLTNWLAEMQAVLDSSDK